MINFDDAEIEELLEKPYWIMDILPKQVPKDSPGQYFAIEEYYLQEPQRTKVRQKYLSVLLKLNCYYDLAVSADCGDHWNENPDPKTLQEWLLADAAGSAVQIVYSTENALMVLNDDDTYMTVYNPTEELLQLLAVLAGAEGLFLWQPEVQV